MSYIKLKIPSILDVGINGIYIDIGINAVTTVIIMIFIFITHI
jgi:hypothetical protein